MMIADLNEPRALLTLRFCLVQHPGIQRSHIGQSATYEQSYSLLSLRSDLQVSSMACNMAIAKGKRAATQGEGARECSSRYARWRDQAQSTCFLPARAKTQAITAAAIRADCPHQRSRPERSRADTIEEGERSEMVFSRERQKPLDGRSGTEFSHFPRSIFFVNKILYLA